MINFCTTLSQTAFLFLGFKKTICFNRVGSHVPKIYALLKNAVQAFPFIWIQRPKSFVIQSAENRERKLVVIGPVDAIPGVPEPWQNIALVV